METKEQMLDNAKRLKNKIKSRESYKQEKKEFDEEYAIAKAIQEARKSSGMTQKELADIMGTKQNVVSRIESGTMGVSLKKLTEYAHAMGKTVKVELV